MESEIEDTDKAHFNNLLVTADGPIGLHCSSNLVRSHLSLPNPTGNRLFLAILQAIDGNAYCTDLWR